MIDIASPHLLVMDTAAPGGATRRFAAGGVAPPGLATSALTHRATPCGQYRRGFSRVIPRSWGRRSGRYRGRVRSRRGVGTLAPSRNLARDPDLAEEVSGQANELVRASRDSRLDDRADGPRGPG